MELLSILSSSLSDAPAGLAVQKLLGIGDGALYRFPIQSLGVEAVNYVNASRTILASDFNGGVMISTSSGTTVLTLPLMWRLGIVDNNSTKAVFAVSRGGLGALFVNPALYRGTVANQAAMLALPTVAVEDYVFRSDLSQWFVLNTGTPGTLGNWVAIPTNAVNQPVVPSNGEVGVTINWGLTSQYDPQYLEQDAVVMVTSKSLDHWRGN